MTRSTFLAFVKRVIGYGAVLLLAAQNGRSVQDALLQILGGAG